MAGLPPRLIAIADAPLWRDRTQRAQFAFAVGRLAAACGRSAWRAGLLLREQDWSPEQWRCAIEELQWLRVFGLALGISAPSVALRPAQLQQLLAWGVDWVQIPERHARAWESGLLTPGTPAIPPTGSAQGTPAPLRPLAQARSCHDLTGVHAALAAGASWATLSPILSTPSKPAAAPLGWAALTQACAMYPHRIIALGGLDAGTAGQALRCGAAGIAVLRAWQDQPQALADAVTEAGKTAPPDAPM